MKYHSLVLRVGISLGLLLAAPFPAGADANVPSLAIREMKISGDEFVVLQANQALRLSDYWLGYSSSDTATSIVPTQQLPPQSLRAGQALLLTSDGAATCDAVLVSKLSVSLSDSKGTLVVRQLESSGASSTFTTVDSVSWGKSTATVKNTNPIDTSRESSLTYPVWYHEASGTSGWQVGDMADCTLTLAGVDSAPPTTVTWPQNDTEPPATIENLASESASPGPYIPAADVGLLPPQITELLPNPTGTGTDGTGEFIELYNPNAAAFDLSGFTLQTGLTTKHSYTFPAGTTLPPRASVAFYAPDTGLTLSNTSGQADVLDPLGTLIAQTDAYSTAKDGMAWALAKGSWYWTTKPTPNAANVINQAVATTIKTTSSQKAAAAVKGTSTTTKPLQTSRPATSTAAAVAAAPIHPYVLVAIAVLAVGYGVYEYRHDLANRFYQSRTNRAARRKARG